MNRDFLEMLHCINIPVISAEVKGMEISVLERQRFSLKWQQDQLQSMLSAQEEYFHGSSLTLNELLTQPIKTDTWIDFGMSNNGLADESSGIQYVGEVDNHVISRTASCLPLPVKGTESKGRQVIASDQKLSGANGRQSFKKRKAEKIMSPKGGVEGDRKSKRTKACLEEEGSTTTSQKSSKKSDVDKTCKRNREASGCTSSEVQKTDFIHVRARRGQATDSHSLAERVRREKISERMKHLQDLVPGCNKITGKAGMLDEIISYVQSLQRQVEFLSMKLAAVNHTFDFSVDDLLAKQVLAMCSTSMSTIGETPDMTNINYLQYNPIQPSQPFYEYEVAENSIDPFRFNQCPSSLPWDGDLQNIHQERYTSSQAFTGNFEASGLKMEM